MTRDLFQEAGIKVDMGASAPRDLFAEAGLKPQPQSLISRIVQGVKNIPGDLRGFSGGFGNSISDVVGNINQNVPKITDYVAGSGASEKFNDYLKGQSPQFNNPAVQEWLKMSGIHNLGNKIQDSMQQAMLEHPKSAKVGEFAGEALPFMAAPEFAGMSEAGLLPRMMLQGSVGVSTNKDALSGGIMNAAGELINPMGTGFLKLLGKKGFAPNLKAKANDLWRITRGYFGNLGENGAKIEEGMAHNKMLDDADKISLNPKYKFDNSEFKKGLQDKIDEIRTDHLSIHPKSPEWNGAIKLMKGWLRAAPDDLYGMIKHNKALNQLYGGQIKPGVPIPDWLPSFGIQNIKKTIQKNIADNKLGSTFGNDLEHANRLTKERVKLQKFGNHDDEASVLGEFNKMDPKEQQNLFSADEIAKIKDFQKSLVGNKRIGSPPHLKTNTEYLSSILKRVPGALAIQGAQVPFGGNSEGQ